MLSLKSLERHDLKLASPPDRGPKTRQHIRAPRIERKHQDARRRGATGDQRLKTGQSARQEIAVEVRDVNRHRPARLNLRYWHCSVAFATLGHSPSMNSRWSSKLSASTSETKWCR